MQVPDRLVRSILPTEHPGLLLATAWGTAVLSVSPFLLPALAEAYEVSLGVASLATAAQLAGFVIGSFGAGRVLAPRGRVLGIALVLSLLVHAACVPLPPFGLLVGLRIASGVTLGVITWFSWSQVFGDEARMSEIAVVGPVVGITTTPVAAELIERFGPGGVFAALAVTATVPLAFSRRSGSSSPALLSRSSPDTGPEPDDESTSMPGERHAPTRQARLILLCLGAMTLGGSSVFTFGAVIATRTTDLSLSVISLAYSANALASIPSARWTGRRGVSGAWFGVCGVAAVVMGASSNGPAFVVAIATWGFAFWMGLPAAYALLARCSRHPRERAGDAQAVMAAGRVIGPLAGGVLLDATSPAVLGLVGGGVLIAAGLGLVRADRSAVAIGTTA